jgi:type IV pilus assembly protein PilB
MFRIGELLIKHGIIKQKQLDEALKLQKKKKKRLGEILIELGYLNSENLLWMISEQADIPFVEVRPQMLDSQLINKFPEDVLYNNLILPLYETEDKIYIAVGDPADPLVVKKMEGFTTKEVITSGADPKKIEQLLNKFFLVQQAEKALETEREAKTTIKITANNAVVEFTDESGKITKKKSRIQIIIDTSKKIGGKK